MTLRPACFSPFQQSLLYLPEVLRNNIHRHRHVFRDCFCGTVTVSGHHNDLGKSCFTQLFNHLGCFFSERIFNADHGCKLVLDCQIQVGIFFRQVFKPVFHSFRYRALFILENEVMASDHSFFAFDRSRNTVCHDILYLCMHLFVIQMPLFGCIYHCFCHRMREMLLQAGCDAKQFIFTVSVKWRSLLQRSVSPR